MNWSRQAAAFDRIFNRQELTRAGSGSLIAAVSEGIVAGQGTGQRAREQIDSDFGLLRVVQQEWNDLDLIELEKVQNFLDGFVRDWVKAVVDKGLEEYWVAALGKFAESSIPKGIGFLIRLSRVICANLEEADFAFIKKVAEIFCKIMRIVNLKQVDNEILKNFFLPMQKWYRPDVNSLLSDLPQTTSPALSIEEYISSTTREVSQTEPNPDFDTNILSPRSKNYKYSSIALNKVLKSFYTKKTPKKTLEKRRFSFNLNSLPVMNLESAELNIKPDPDLPTINQISSEVDTSPTKFSPLLKDETEIPQKKSKIKSKPITRNKSKKGKKSKTGKKANK